MLVDGSGNVIVDVCARIQSDSYINSFSSVGNCWPYGIPGVILFYLCALAIGPIVTNAVLRTNNVILVCQYTKTLSLFRVRDEERCIGKTRRDKTG